MIRVGSQRCSATVSFRFDLARNVSLEGCTAAKACYFWKMFKSIDVVMATSILLQMNDYEEDVDQRVRESKVEGVRFGFSLA